MRHHDAHRKFGRTKNQRVALVRGLVRSLILKERITTTEAKAKTLRPKIEKMVTVAKRADLSSRRNLLSELYNSQAVVKRLVEEIAPRYKERPGGYTRITKLTPRRSDASPRAVIEFV